MIHLNEEQLVLHYYGEVRDTETQCHLDECEECRGQYRSLQRVLNVVDTWTVPERDGEYGARVWEKLQHQLPRQVKISRGWFAWPAKWAAAGAMALLLAGAFYAGRFTRHPATPFAVAEVPYDSRILLSAVGNHLDRSQIVLVELANVGKEADFGPQQTDLRDLIDANRLYRTSASVAGERAVADVLDELERLLLEVAHLAPTLTPEAAEELRQRITGQGILLKVRIVGSELREREKGIL